MPCVARGAVGQWPGGDEANKADTRRASGWRRAGRRCRRIADGPSCGAGERAAVEEAGGDHRRSLVFWVVSKQSDTELLLWANGSVGKKTGGDTTTRTEIETAGSGKDLGFGFSFGRIAGFYMGE